MSKKPLEVKEAEPWIARAEIGMSLEEMVEKKVAVVETEEMRIERLLQEKKSRELQDELALLIHDTRWGRMWFWVLLLLTIASVGCLGVGGYHSYVFEGINPAAGYPAWISILNTVGGVGTVVAGCGFLFAVACYSDSKVRTLKKRHEIREHYITAGRIIE
ncbi:hypothetical protein BJD55_gp102 [Gordonia phage Yvonnetastic]|uniref:Uncharacterized protein n=1 Tax=Gordonia phage Yvonnetastic TaxID=1821566 RepID=A0A142K981_9CAUD|nr:hypothetical protein BJD55_gp102 [Gordonia phage Yvonnetastic]AMS02664.1 hypothetical protein SEA_YVONNETASTIC_120 [Gordonia phage Yvonnetastic]